VDKYVAWRRWMNMWMNMDEYAVKGESCLDSISKHEPWCCWWWFLRAMKAWCRWMNIQRVVNGWICG